MKFKKNVPTIIGRLTYIVGLFDILANIFRPFKLPAKRIDGYLPIFINSTAFATAVFTGLALIILARGLTRKKRRARNLAIIILAINLASELFRFHYHPIQQVGAVLLIVLLIAFRKEFYAISDPTTKFAPLRAFIYSSLVMLVFGLVIIYFRHGDQIVGDSSFGNVLLTVIEGMVGVSGPIEFASERISDTVGVALAAFGIFTLIFPLWLFVRPIKPEPKMTEEELQLVKTLVMRDEDQDSLGYFATRQDKSVIWSDNKKAGIAYRVQNGVMLASGDPFGEYSLWGETIEKFLAYASLHAWTPAVMGASDRGGEVWVERANMLAVDIGDEAIINVADFTLEGRPMGNVRHMVNRVSKAGYSTYSSRFGDLTPQVQEQLRGLTKKWRYGVAERGFSMAMDRFGGALDSDSLVTVAQLAGEVKGILYFVPWGKTKISLDRMQRENGVDSGLNELMIAQTVAYARENGITHISLNFAAFRSLFERADKISAGPITRTTRNLIRFASNWFQIESLYRFNAKFQPEWQTRYVIYPKASDLVRVGYSALRAEKFITGFGKNKLR
jgi:lysyl-tRNA synthetase class 2